METFQYISDVHLKFNGDFVLHPHPKNKDGNLIIAGDLCSDKVLIEKFLGVACSNFTTIYYTPGNHEYYNSSMTDTKKFFKKLENKFNNLFILNRRIIKTQKGTILAGATLWSDIPVQYGSKIELEPIKNFSHKKRQNLYKKDLEFLINAIVQYPDCVVITHHSPSFKYIPKKYKGDISNYRYANSLEFLFPLVKKWVFGHTHKRVRGTKVVSCPVGVPDEKIKYSEEYFII